LPPAINLKTRFRLPMRLPLYRPSKAAIRFRALAGYLGRLALAELWRQPLGSFSFALACDKEDIGWTD
jgi:hypothetical protein